MVRIYQDWACCTISHIRGEVSRQQHLITHRVKSRRLALGLALRSSYASLAGFHDLVSDGLLHDFLSVTGTARVAACTCESHRPQLRLVLCCECCPGCAVPWMLSIQLRRSRLHCIAC